MPTIETDRGSKEKIKASRQKLEFKPTPSEKFIVAVVNLKGGVAKTTTAVHVAEFLRQFGATVLVDGDPNRSAMSWSGRDERPESDSLQVVTEIELARYAQRASCFVIDTQARPDPKDIQATIRTASLIILPTTPSGDDLRVTADLADSLKAHGSTRHRVLLTRVPSGRQTLVKEARQYFSQLDIPMFQTLIRQYEAYKHAFVQGVPVHQVKNPKSKEAWGDYEKLMKEILADDSITRGF